MHKFRELKVWKEAVDLAVSIYSITKAFPPEEKFGLTSQMRRCSVSIPSNISEGSARNSDKLFISFLSIANGSAAELITQTIIAERVGIIQPDTSEKIIKQTEFVQKMISSLSKSLGSNLSDPEADYNISIDEKLKTPSIT